MKGESLTRLPSEPVVYGRLGGWNPASRYMSNGSRSDGVTTRRWERRGVSEGKTEKNNPPPCIPIGDDHGGTRSARGNHLCGLFLGRLYALDLEKERQALAVQ